MTAARIEELKASEDLLLDKVAVATKVVIHSGLSAR